MTTRNRRYLDALDQKALVFDGAMGTSLQKQNLTAEHFGGESRMGCNDALVLSYPAAVEIVHRSFLDVGVDVIETCTFRANRLTLAEYGLADQVETLNEAAARLARRLADEYAQSTGQPRFVAGSIGPSGKLPSMNDPELSNVTFDDLAQVFREQARGLIRGGVDVLLIETSQDILEVKAAIDGIQQAFEDTNTHLPIQAQVTLDTTGRMLLGTDIAAVFAILEGLPIDVIGLNCSTGPDYMREPIRWLGEHSSLPVSCIPNAGLPLNIDGQAIYPLAPGDYAVTLTAFVQQFGVRVVGGCCGTTPAHLEVLVKSLRGAQAHRLETFVPPQLASAVAAQPLEQQPRPFLIGERLNTQGSRAFKKMMLEEDFDGALALAVSQMDAGAHGLDLCTALTERPDEKELMRRLIKTLAPTVRIPLVIDTTELDVLETALKTAPGRCLINSTHLEGGEEKARRILGIAKRYNAAVICLTIDEQGMAKTAVRKLAVARRIHDIAVNDLGLRPQDLVFDALTFTLATGDAEFTESATETLEGIRLIKTHLPGVFTSLGVSNVSFGLAASAREVINSVMLYHAVQAGLDMAIVNPAQVMPYAEIPADARSLVEDLIFHRHPEALARVIAHFSTTTSAAARPEATQTILQSMQPEERLGWRILHRHKEGVEADIDSLVLPYPPAERSDAAVRVLNSILLPAMKDVGDRFGAGELILPFVLQSAEVMKKAVAHLETYLERQAGVTKGTMVLATVYGDVHDIGKNLVKTILSNNGYTVIDLGKQVPAETIIAKAVEVNADAIGLSALLVSTSRQMPLIVNELHRRGLKFPVLIGGAAINRRFGRRILKTESGDWYPGGVFYCKDAFEALGVMDELSKTEGKTALLTRNQQEADAEAANTRTEDSPATLPARSNIQPAQTIPTPTKWGVRIVRSMPLDSVFQLLSINELYRLSWGAKNTHGSEWDQLKAEYDARLTHMRRQAIAEGWLSPQGVYGIFPAQSDGDDLVVYNPDTLASGKPVEIARFGFPRQPDGERLCLADYFASRDSGRMDTVAFQVVTVGNDATRRFDALQAAGDYTEGYFVHGLAVQTAEATAEYLHRHIRRELGLAEDQGKRYSWGYPAIPDLADHAQVFKLLPAESELGMSLTSAFQLVPEQSTAAIILHHPDARYFHIGETRIEQLTKSGG